MACMQIGSMELLPEEIILQIASLLQEEEVLALGSCGRSCCSCDSLWERFFRRRWPRVEPPHKDQGWWNLYITRHKEIAEKASPAVRRVEETLRTAQSIEVGLYQETLEDLRSLQLSFLDVKMLLFKPKYSAVLRLVGLHYCVIHLEVPVKDMVEAVVDNEISEYEVCVQWSTLGGLLYGSRMRDESPSLVASLHDIASSPGHKVLQLLTRGAVHEVTRVQISLPSPTS